MKKIYWISLICVIVLCLPLISILHANESASKALTKKSPTCNKVASLCEGKAQWSRGPNYWCAGPGGCGDEQTACASAIVTNVQGIGFDNLNGVNYACGCGDNQFGSGEENLRNECFDLQKGLPGICQKKGVWFSAGYFCDTTT